MKYTSGFLSVHTVFLDQSVNYAISQHEADQHGVDSNPLINFLESLKLYPFGRYLLPWPPTRTYELFLRWEIMIQWNVDATDEHLSSRNARSMLTLDNLIALFAMKAGLIRN